MPRSSIERRCRSAISARRGQGTSLNKSPVLLGIRNTLVRVTGDPSILANGFLLLLATVNIARTLRHAMWRDAKAVDAHLRYLERDGVTKDVTKGQVYSAERDAEDGRAFLERGRDDRHQFRFIVSSEDGVDLADLRTTTRDLMRQMEADLGTKLDWIAVDHHNTGHPHTHILLRGITDDGKTLNIAGDYIAYGIRERASEIVTLELGRQTELEVTKQLEREVDADRFTGLDRMLIAEQQGREFSDLRPDQDMRDTFRQNRALLIERARKLERMGLATEIEIGRWIVSPKAEPVRRELGERGAIIKTMHRALQREGLAEDRHPGGYVLHRESATALSSAACLIRGLVATRWASGSGWSSTGGRARASHRDECRPRRGRRPRHDRRGRLRPSRASRRGPQYHRRSRSRRCLSPVPASGASARRDRPYRRRSRSLRSLPRPPAGGVAPGGPCRAGRRRPLARFRRSSRTRSSLRSCPGSCEYPNKRPVSQRP
jgi:type IV secretory pathway VirD2 relaxase